LGRLLYLLGHDSLAPALEAEHHPRRVPDEELGRPVRIELDVDRSIIEGAKEEAAACSKTLGGVSRDDILRRWLRKGLRPSPSRKDYFRRSRLARLADLASDYICCASGIDDDKEEDAVAANEIAGILLGLYLAAKRHDYSRIRKWEALFNRFLKTVPDDQRRQLGVLPARSHRGRGPAVAALTEAAKECAAELNPPDNIARWMMLKAIFYGLPFEDEAILAEQIRRAQKISFGEPNWWRKILALTLSQCGLSRRRVGA
jgi:hypothetical protein